MLDQTDLRIIDLLQEDSSISNAVLAQKLALKASTVYERVKKLERSRIIHRYAAQVDPDAVGKPILAFIRLIVGPTTDYSKSKKHVAELCIREPSVLECHVMAGEDDYLLKVRAANMRELELLIEKIRSSTTITNSIISSVLSSPKETFKVTPSVTIGH
ncbi:MAG: Lrp/AsnC family transcriptional regulator [Chloroflexota bacterium]